MCLPKVFAWLAVVLLISQTAGCYHYLSVAPPTPTTYDKVRVALHSGKVLVLEEARVDSFTVAGEDPVDGEEIEVPIEEVHRVYARKFDTLGVTMIGLTFSVTAALMAVLLSFQD